MRLIPFLTPNYRRQQKKEKNAFAVVYGNTNTLSTVASTLPNYPVEDATLYTADTLPKDHNMAGVTHTLPLSTGNNELSTGDHMVYETGNDVADVDRNVVYSGSNSYPELPTDFEDVYSVVKK